MKRICTIAVRGGSKGVPGKNWRLVNGKPLFAYSLDHALQSGLFDTIVVSSDADEVLSSALSFGATDTVKRPAELASDTSGKVAAIVHAVSQMEAKYQSKFDIVVDLDATSPLREVSDVIGAVQQLEKCQIDSIITATPSHRSPYFNLVEVNPETQMVQVSKQLPDSILRRQDAPKTYDMNASIYVWNRNSLMEHPTVFFPNTQIFEMPPERSQDIDSEYDFKIVSWLLEQRMQNG